MYERTYINREGTNMRSEGVRGMMREEGESEELNRLQTGILILSLLLTGYS